MIEAGSVEPAPCPMSYAQRDFGGQSKAEHSLGPGEALLLDEGWQHQRRGNPFNTSGDEPSRRKRLLPLYEPSRRDSIAGTRFYDVSHPFP